jgi:subtilisin family serine protease
MKKFLGSFSIVLILISIFGEIQPAQASTSIWRMLNPAVQKISPALQKNLNALAPNEKITVIVTLRQQADLTRINGKDRKEKQKNVLNALQDTANATQGKLKKLLDNRKKSGLADKYTSLWIINGISVTARASVINELAGQSDVLAITTDDIQIVPVTQGPPETNLSITNAPALWSQGYYGQGVVVASMDSGVDVSHPDLASRWRGGSNSWFDPYNQHSTPVDMSGHGTWTTGIMVAGDAGGTSVGVAPGAQWIAVKIFNDQGGSTATAIHQGFQWLLDPDGNPNTNDAPQVVNNSWTFAYPGCNLDFELDMQSLRASNILPVFAAGNGGPYGNTSYSPSNNPSAFAVGATNNNDKIYAYSSRGPSTCGGSSGPFPDIVAPGVNILTTGLYGTYYTNSGTSFAAPHVAGGLALLLSAFPNLNAVTQEQALINSAVDLGAAGPDDVFGYGRLNLLSAFNWLAAAPTETPSPLPTSTIEAVLTDTPTPTLVPTYTPTYLPTDTPTTLPTLTVTSVPSNTPTVLPTFTFTPVPTNTPTVLPTFTKTSTPTSTATVALSAFHIGDLDGSSAPSSSTTWKATVTIYVHNASEAPLSGVKVNVTWTNGATGSASCTTNSNGYCSVSKTLSTSKTSVTLSVTSATRSSYTYNASANHDPDGDSNGTMIVILKP